MSLLAISGAQAVLVGLASGLAVVLIWVASVGAMRRGRARRPGPDIPPGMRPGPSDADLERPLLERLYGWGVVLVLAMALSTASVFITENVTNANDTRDILEESIHRGHLTTLAGSEENQLGFNCVRCHGNDFAGGHNVFNGAVVQVPGLRDVCGGAEFGHPQIKSLEDVIDTIAQGRPGTDMPSWSVRYAGAMHDQQINDVVNYILSIQEVPEKQNVCINPVEEEQTEGQAA